MPDYIFKDGELYNTDELMHYGVPGMKWGRRKARPLSAVQQARRKYKTANKEYNKAFKKANRYSSTHLISQFVGKKAKAESNKRWSDAADKARAADKAKAAYKKAKKDSKLKERNKKNTNVAKNVAKGAQKVSKIMGTIGTLYLTDQIFYGGTGTKLAKAATKKVGRKAVETVVKARGGTVLGWYD